MLSSSQITHHGAIALAVRAPVAMDRVLGDDRSDRLGDVLSDPGSCLVGPSERSVALGTGWEPMIRVAVDDLGCWPPRAGMSGLAPGTFATAIGLGLEIRRDHRRRGGRSDDGCCRGRRLGHPLGQSQEGEDNGFFAFAIDFPSLLLSERRSERNVESGSLVRHRHSPRRESQDRYRPAGSKARWLSPAAGLSLTTTGI